MVQEVRDEPGFLEMLVSAFSFWDKFDHLKAASCFRNLRGKFDARWQIDTSRSKEIVFKIAKQQEKYAASGDIKYKYSDEFYMPSVQEAKECLEIKLKEHQTQKEGN
jgi:hypothetical protein